MMHHPFTLPGTARIWIYQADRAFTLAEQQEIQVKLSEFAASWNAHGIALSAEAYVLHNFFIVLAVDERVTNASGCSIDSSVKVIKQIEQHYAVSLTNRLNTVVLQDQKTKLYTIDSLKKAIDSGEIDASTLVFDNTITHLNDLSAHWLKPISQSWQKKYLSTFANN